MTYLRKAAQQALEAIHLWHWASETHLLMAAHDALRIALEQPKQEPVAWMYQDKSTHEVRFQKHMRSFVDHGRTYETPLYTTPPQRTWVGLTDEDVEEVERWVEFKEEGSGRIPMGKLVRYIETKLNEKTRTWVGLSTDEFKFIASKYLLSREAGLEYFQEEIEVKLKEKNT